jgi:nucleoside-diphosphate-sugar epimerase
MSRILIIGAGYTGKAMAQHFQEQGHEVWGLVRSAEHAITLESISVHPIIADVTQPKTLKDLPEVDSVILSMAAGRRNVSQYHALYIDGVQNCLQILAQQNPPTKIIYLSSTGVYGHQSDWVDETTPCHPNSDRSTILLEAEKVVLQSNLPTLIFRLAGIYGPDRHRLKVIENQEWPTDSDNTYMNMIHRDDIVQATALLLEKGEPGQIYLGVDDAPVPRAEFYQWLGNKLGIDLPDLPFISKPATGKRCRNQRLKELGYHFIYPSFREGYQDGL